MLRDTGGDWVDIHMGCSCLECVEFFTMWVITKIMKI